MEVRDIRRTLLQKLHAVEDTKRNHVFYYFERDGKHHKATKLSHGTRGQLGDNLVYLIASQLRLQKNELESLIDCPLSEDEYFVLWDSRNPRQLS